MNISFRPATTDDFEFCTRIYVDEAKRHTPPAEFDMVAIRDSIAQRWEHKETRIITLDGADIGWVQAHVRDDALFIRQFMVDEALRGRGIGTAVMRMLIAGADRDKQPLTLGVVKENRAKNLYERLGFRITHDDERKFYMRRDTPLKKL